MNSSSLSAMSKMIRIPRLRKLSVRIILLTMLFASAALAERNPSPQQIFDERILPIFKSDQPSSCVQCHLAGVDLKNYIHPSQEKTFASLRDQGMIDLDQPEKSKILRLINMTPQESHLATRIHEGNRKLEYAAFSTWIKAACNNPKLHMYRTRSYATAVSTMYLIRSRVTSGRCVSVALAATCRADLSLRNMWKSTENRWHGSN